MGTASDAELLARAVRNPGRLVMGPSTVAGAFPFGGVSLGFTRYMHAQWDVEYQRTADPTNGELGEIARRRIESLRLEGIAEGPVWDEDLIQAMYSATTRPSSLAVTSPPEAQIRGGGDAKVVSAMPPVLFVPNDVERGDAVYILRPAATLLGEAIAFALTRKCGMPFRLEPLSVLGRDPYQVCRIANVIL